MGLLLHGLGTDRGPTGAQARNVLRISARVGAAF